MKTKLTIFIAILLIIAIYAAQADAATIVLRSGVTVKGKLIDRTDDEITIQDPDTKQMRIIKTIFVRDLVLEPDEQKLAEKLEKKKKKGKDLKLRGTDEGEDLLKVIQPTIGLMPGIAYPLGKVASKIRLGYGAHPVHRRGHPHEAGDLQGPLRTFRRLSLSPDQVSQIVIEHHDAPHNRLYETSIHLRRRGAALHQDRRRHHPGHEQRRQLHSIRPLPPHLDWDMLTDKIPFMEFFLEAGMMMAFEKVRGDFITVNMGFAYRFGAPPATHDRKN